MNGSYSKRLSEEQLKYLKALKIKKVDDQKFFNSFRVNVIMQLANNGISVTLASRVVGYGTERGMDVHFGYVRELPDQKKVVDSLVLPINLQKLSYQVEFRSFIANKNKWND